MSSKRKASSMAATADSPDSKRRKLPSAIAKETPEGTTIAGTPVMEHIREARDKRGHLISTEFLTLPDKNEIPEYYEAITLPIAVDTIEKKLERHEYPTLTALESDLKRMVANAKNFNEKGSEIHGDAEKIRKLVSNHMVKINPAYANPNYAPFPTPLPDVDESRTKEEPNGEREQAEYDVGEEEDAEGEPDEGELDAEEQLDADGERDDAENEAEMSEGKKRPKMILHGPRSGKEQPARRVSSTPALQGAADSGEVFAGDTFQQAQEKLVIELMEMVDEEGALMAGPFINLPPRDLRDYYQVVKNPVSLKGVHKRVRGVRGREKPTGTTLFKSWQAFEDEVHMIWNNARLYNEDGSVISELAGELETHFKNRLAEAKAAVPEPSQPKVTLRMSAKEPEPSTKLKLHLTSKSGTTETNGVMVDSAALKRQQELVTAGANGLANPVRDAVDASQTPSMPVQGQEQPASGRTSLPPASNGIKPEAHASNSPGLRPSLARNVSDMSGEGAAPTLAGSMPPPSSTTPRVTSASPHPQMAHRPTTPHISTNPLDNRFRPAGKGVADALIQNVTISTHPGLHIAKHFSLSIPPSSSLSQQSVTLSLPRTHDCLRIAPTFSPTISPRQSVYFVTINGQRLQPVTVRSPELEPSQPVYETRVMPGISQVQIEMLSSFARGAPKVGSDPEFEFEKTTIFVNLME